MIKTKNDALKIIESLQDYEMIELRPHGHYGNLRVYITKNGCREFYNGAEGEIGEDDQTTIVSMLYEYRKTYNEGENPYGQNSCHQIDYYWSTRARQL